MKRYETMTKKEIVDAFTSVGNVPDNCPTCQGCFIHEQRVKGNITENICGSGKGTCRDIICRYLNEDVKGQAVEPDKIMEKETQQFIRRLKEGETVREALKEMTYGFEDKNGDYQVASFDLVKQFFIDYLNCCDRPGNAFRNMLEFKTNIDIQEYLHPVTQMLAGRRAGNDNAKYEDAMASTLLTSQVRDGSGYINGFSELIEEDED